MSVVSNARSRRYHEENERLRAEGESLRAENRRLVAESERLAAEQESERVVLRERAAALEIQRDRALAEAESAKAGAEVLCSDIERLRGELHLSSERARVAQAEATRLGSECAILGEQLEETVRDRFSYAQGRVKEWRLSRQAYELKESYSQCFIQAGFYLCREYLESLRPGTAFPELIFGAATEAIPAPCDWRRYEPESLAPDVVFSAAARDWLHDLAGPWDHFDPAEGLSAEDLESLRLHELATSLCAGDLSEEALGGETPMTVEDLMGEVAALEPGAAEPAATVGADEAVVDID